MDVENDIENGDLVSRDGAQVRCELSLHSTLILVAGLIHSLLLTNPAAVGAFLFTIHGSIAPTQAGAATSIRGRLEISEWSGSTIHPPCALLSIRPPKISRPVGL